MRLSLVAAIVFTICVPLVGEMARPIPPRSFLPPRSFIPPQPAMRRAGIIFSGIVLKVEQTAQPGFPGITQITFRVESGIRGARRGQNLTVREWEGLWNSGERYRTGEHVLLFLYPQSKLGLTSPVGGALGRYEVDRNGRVMVNGSGPTSKPVRLLDFTSAIRRVVQEQ